MPQSSSRRAERRETVRADAQLSMRLGANGSVAPEIVTETQNISASGLYCLSPHYLAPLSKVDLTLVLPDGSRNAAGRLVTCEAVVVRCQAAADSRRRYELACSFLGLPEAQRRVLAEYVALRNLRTLSAATAKADGKRGGAKKRAAAKPKTARTRATATRGAAKRGTVKRTTRTRSAAAPATRRKAAKKTAARRRG